VLSLDPMVESELKEAPQLFRFAGDDGDPCMTQIVQNFRNMRRWDEFQLRILCQQRRSNFEHGRRFAFKFQIVVLICL
jgi:hypothetical protein